MWKPQSHVKSWTPIDNDEIYENLGMIMLMGIIKKRTLKSYFSKKPVLDIPIFGQTMTQDRFELITKFFHFVDNAAQYSYSDPKKAIQNPSNSDIFEQ
jgi:hypothetical protein